MRIVSWNIQWGRGADGRVDLERTASVIRDIGAVDVICLQEVAQHFPGLSGGHGEDGVGVLSAAFPGYEAVFGAALDVPDGKGGRARFGNLTLSRVAVGQVFRHLLPSPADPAVPSMQRMCVEVVLASDAGGVRIMNTHLEYYSDLQRGAQIERLLALHRESALRARVRVPDKDTNPGFRAWPRPASAVLCGDFNCEPGSPGHVALQADPGPEVPRLCDAWLALNGTQAHPPTVGLHGAEWPDRAFCCDFAFVSADLVPRISALRVVSDTSASDHQPLVLDLA